MKEPVKLYENLLWEILDDGSKLAVIEILIGSGFDGDCKMIAKIDGETTVLEVRDEHGHELILPINILDILNN